MSRDVFACANALKTGHDSAFNIAHIKSLEIGPFVIRINLDADGRVRHYHRESNNLLVSLIILLLLYYRQFTVAPGTRTVALRHIVRVRVSALLFNAIKR